VESYREGHWWHAGDLAGTSAILVRTATRFCWAALTNARRYHTPDALDEMVWEMVLQGESVAKGTGLRLFAAWEMVIPCSKAVHIRRFAKWTAAVELLML
jgi:hypothetical protein